MRLSRDGARVLRPQWPYREGIVYTVACDGTRARLIWDGTRVPTVYYAARHLEVISGSERNDPLPPDIVERFAHVQLG